MAVSPFRRALSNKRQRKVIRSVLKTAALIKSMRLDSTKSGLQFYPCTAPLGCGCDRRLQQLASNSSAAIGMMYNHFVDVCQQTLRPDAVLERHGTESGDSALR